MNQYSQEVSSENPDEFARMRETLTKVAPLAVAILGALILTPIWLPIASISSFVLGPITWIMAGVIGSAVGQVAKKVMREFDRQCPQIVNFVTAHAVRCQRTEEADSPVSSGRNSPVQGSSSTERPNRFGSFFGGRA